jgi:ComF family protein
MPQRAASGSPPAEGKQASVTAGWTTWISTLAQALLDLLYPPRCPGCGRLGSLFCEHCLALIEPIRPPVCQRCGRPLDAGPAAQPGSECEAVGGRWAVGLCPTCWSAPSPLDGVTAVAVFAHPLRQAIHTFKYEDGRSLAPILGKLMVEAWHAGQLSADVIVPVPLHASRLAERGYNQSALLAHVLGQGVGVAVRPELLVRQRATQPQVGLTAQERRQNVGGAFACRGQVAGQRVVLVDDVCTTGATLEVCASALKEGGAAVVWGFTLARPRWDPTYAEAPG